MDTAEDQKEPNQEDMEQALLQQWEFLNATD